MCIQDISGNFETKILIQKYQGYNNFWKITSRILKRKCDSCEIPCIYTYIKRCLKINDNFFAQRQNGLKNEEKSPLPFYNIAMVNELLKYNS